MRETERWLLSDDRARLVFDNFDVDWPDNPNDALTLMQPFESQPPRGQTLRPGQIWISHPTFRSEQAIRQYAVGPAELASALNASGQGNTSTLRYYLSASYTVRLDGRTRFALAEPKPSGDLLQPPQNHLWALFKDDAARARVRQLTSEAFGLHFVIDPTAIQTLRIRMSQRSPTSSVEEQALDATARAFHGAAPMITELSDGVQAFVGLTSAVQSLRHKVILIDEPEAFLHPPLARRLGTNLGNLATERNATLMVATHSAAFLMGSVEAVPETTVIRLTYQGGVATARALDSGELARMIRDPLLRSTGVLEGLFHRAVVVSESDTDRAFYDEVNRRLLAVGRGTDDTRFLNAQGKDSIYKIVGPLRGLGIPAAAIVDLDVIRQTGPNWTRILEACGMDGPTRTGFETERAHAAQAFAALPPRGDGRDRLKVEGIAALTPADSSRVETFISSLAGWGLLVVPGGELESWLSSLGIGGHGPAWLVRVFEAMGSDGASAGYVQPAVGDVWAFIDKLATWVNNPSRFGVA